MSFYECVVLLRQDLTQQQAENLIQKFSQTFETQGGKVSKVEYWGLRQLAYRIKKNRKGHYHLMNLEGTPAAVAEMERTMGLDEDTLRFLTTRVDKLEEGPSIQMRYRPERDEGSSRETRGGPQDGYRQHRSASSTDEEVTNVLDDIISE